MSLPTFGFAFAGTFLNLDRLKEIRAFDCRMKVRKKWILIGAAVVIAAMFLINPRLTNPPVESGHDIFASNAPPAQIVTLIHGACYDCHSHETVWPWYSHVAPVSWWLVGHVNDGRKRLNFSDWPHNDPKRAVRWLNRISDSVGSNEMPFPNYDRMHPAARLTQAQRDEIVHWAEQESDRIDSQNGTKEKE
jgi:hypothetical protein